MKIYIEQANVLPAIASVLEQASNQVKSGPKGPIIFALLDPTLPGEVEMDAGLDYPVNPQIKGAIKSLNGVLEIEEV